MNITKDESSPTEVTLNVEMNEEDVEPFINRSYRRLVSRVNIPGFRPGKAPRSIVESHLGRAALVQEALEFMVPETLNEVLQQEKLEAFMQPDLEILEVEPVSFKAVVPLEPVVSLGDMTSIELERQPVDVTDEQVEELVERLRFDAAPWEPVERAVQFGDLLTLNVEGIIEGEPAIGDQGIDFIPQQENPLPIPGFSVYLEGLAEGQEKEFTLTVPAEHHQPDYAGKECRFKVEVLSIKEKQLPELDDEFPKGVRAGYESLEALRTHLREQLTEAAENASLRQAEQDSLDELLKIATIQASDMIYQRELDNMYEERERAVRNQRMDMDTYLSHIGQTEEDWREQLKPQAEQRLHTYLVLRKLAEQEGIDVDTSEIDAEVDTMTSQSGDSQDTMRQALSSEGAQDSIRSSLLSRKVLARLVEIVEGTGEPRAASGEPPAASNEDSLQPEDELVPPEDSAEDSADESDQLGQENAGEPTETSEEGVDPDAE